MSLLLSPATAIVRKVLIVGLMTVAATAHVAPTRADSAALPCPGLIRECDEVFYVSTRKLGCGDPRSHVGQFSYEERTNAGWQRSSLEALLANDDPNVTTIFFVHGNRYECSIARNEGITTYRNMVHCRTCDQPVRFVIFSWPSAEIDGRILEDVLVKAARTNPQAYYFAWLLDQLGTKSPVSIIGHSYGARITTGALHLLGGGTLCGWRLAERVHPEATGYEVVLVATAIDSCWLLPGQLYGRAISQMSHLLLINNSCDRALKHYRRLYSRRSSIEALGYVGFPGVNRLGADAAKISQIDACCYLGKVHSWETYLQIGSLMTSIRNRVLPLKAAEVATIP